MWPAEAQRSCWTAHDLHALVDPLILTSADSLSRPSLARVWGHPGWHWALCPGVTAGRARPSESPWGWSGLSTSCAGPRWGSWAPRSRGPAARHPEPRVSGQGHGAAAAAAAVRGRPPLLRPLRQPRGQQCRARREEKASEVAAAGDLGEEVSDLSAPVLPVHGEPTPPSRPLRHLPDPQLCLSLSPAHPPSSSCPAETCPPDRPAPVSFLVSFTFSSALILLPHGLRNLSGSSSISYPQPPCACSWLEGGPLNCHSPARLPSFLVAPAASLRG